MNTDELISLLEEIAESEDTERILNDLREQINTLERTQTNAYQYHKLQKIVKVVRLIQIIDDGQSIKDWR